MAHRSRAASLRRTSQSAAASRAPSVPSASNCRTVVRSRVTFFTGRCRSKRTLCLKGHHGESKIQRTYRRSRPRARKRKTCRTRPWLRICSALKHRHPPTGLSRRLSRSIRAASVGAHPNQGFCERLRDGFGRLTLHVRSYGSRLTSALPVVCLPGLARTAADFRPLAAALAAGPAKPRLVLALDYRGHGQSKYDRNPDNYTLPVALADLSAVLTALEIAPAIFVGTSYGGLLAMMLAVLRPTAIAGVFLNDIRPVIQPQGFVPVQGPVGKLPI